MRNLWWPIVSANTSVLSDGQDVGCGECSAMAVTIRWHTTGEQHDGHVFDADSGELLAQCRYTIARDPWLGWGVSYFSNPAAKGVLVGSGKTLTDAKGEAESHFAMMARSL